MLALLIRIHLEIVDFNIKIDLFVNWMLWMQMKMYSISFRCWFNTMHVIKTRLVTIIASALFHGIQVFIFISIANIWSHVTETYLDTPNGFITMIESIHIVFGILLNWFVTFDCPMVNCAIEKKRKILS